MHRIDGAGHVSGSFSGGTPGVVEATHMTPDWANAVQEELVGLVEDLPAENAGTLVKANNGQVRAALLATFGQLGEENAWEEGQTFDGGAEFPNGTSVTFNTAPTLNAGGSVVGSTLAGSSGGSFSVDAAGEFAYNPARTEYVNVPGMTTDWQYSGTGPGVAGGTAIFYGDGANCYIASNTGGGYWVGRAQLPKGAIITSLEFALANAHASADAVVGVGLTLNTRRPSGVGGFTQLYDGAIVFNGDVGVPANTTGAIWVSATPTTTQTMPNDGWARASVYFKTTNGATATDGNVKCYGMRVGYTISKVSGAT